MTSELLKRISTAYELVPVDAGDMAKMKVSGMSFDIKAYTAKGLGHVSVMRAKGFFGLMKMDTLIINPTEKDLPLYSYDRIFAMGNDTLIVELYDTNCEKLVESGLEAAKSAYASLPERDPGEHWYDSIKLGSSISKKGKKKQSAELDRLTLEHFEAYMNAPVSDSPDVEIKQTKAAYYVNGLLEKGGPSTDVFKKGIGEDATAELFKKVLFGI